MAAADAVVVTISPFPAVVTAPDTAVLADCAAVFDTTVVEDTPDEPVGPDPPKEDETGTTSEANRSSSAPAEQLKSVKTQATVITRRCGRRCIAQRSLGAVDGDTER
ncbi:MAG: hypothetical protein ACKV2O_21715 [Acidimicrobiales bacterium]